jgi:hypothetical protein
MGDRNQQGDNLCVGPSGDGQLPTDGADIGVAASQPNGGAPTARRTWADLRRRGAGQGGIDLRHRGAGQGGIVRGSLVRAREEMILFPIYPPLLFFCFTWLTDSCD